MDRKSNEPEIRLHETIRTENKIILKRGIQFGALALTSCGLAIVGLGACSYYDACRHMTSYPESLPPVDPSSIIQGMTFGIIGAAVAHRARYIEVD